MPYIDLIAPTFPLTLPTMANNDVYRSVKFNVANKVALGVTVKASQILSVAIAYGESTDTAAAAGLNGSAALPFMTPATSFASVTGAEGGTYHELAVPPSARQAQLVVTNASGSSVAAAVIDAALRCVAYPGSASNVSADEIATTLGYANAAAMVAAISAGGSNILSGSGAPSGGTGNNGDYYLRTSNGDFYGPKASGAWGSPIVNLTGPAGPAVALTSISGTNTIVATATGVTLAAGMVFSLIPANSITGATTLNINSGGGLAIKQANGTTALVTGDLVAGQAQLVHYDGTLFRLVGASVVRVVMADSFSSPNDGTYRDVFDLAGFTYHGQIRAYESTSAGHTWYAINTTTLTQYSDFSPEAHWSAVGTPSTVKSTLRISGGKIQAYTGTSMSTNLITLVFEGVRT